MVALGRHDSVTISATLMVMHAADTATPARIQALTGHGHPASRARKPGTCSTSGPGQAARSIWHFRLLSRSGEQRPPPSPPARRDAPGRRRLPQFARGLPSATNTRSRRNSVTDGFCHHGCFRVRMNLAILTRNQMGETSTASRMSNARVVAPSGCGQAGPVRSLNPSNASVMSCRPVRVVTKPCGPARTWARRHCRGRRITGQLPARHLPDGSPRLRCAPDLV